MPSKVSIDSDLLEEALKIGGFSTKQDTVNQALTEFIQRCKQREIIDVFGHLAPDSDYNYKQGR